MAGAPSAGRSFGAYRLVQALEGERGAYLVVRGESDERFLLQLLGARPPSRDEAQIELERYAALSHVAIHRLVDWFDVDNSMAVVFEHVEGVPLARLMRYLERDSERLPDAAIWFLGWRLVGALSKAHLARDRGGLLAPIVHGRLSPHDILVSWKGEVRVLGLCPYVGDVDPVPARAWLAPELRRGEAPNAKSDTFATAMIMRALLTARPPPAPGASIPPLRKLRPDIPVDVARALDRALHAEPARRPSCSELAQRFEGLVRLAEGRTRLRECMELYRALWGLWSEATPEVFVPTPPISGEVLKTQLEEEPAPETPRSAEFGPRDHPQLDEPSHDEPSHDDPLAKTLPEGGGEAANPSNPTVPPASSVSPSPARDEALAWRWVAFGALAVAAAAIAWHRIRPPPAEAPVEPPVAAAPQALAPPASASSAARPQPSAKEDATEQASTSEEPGDAKRSPRWPARSVSSAGIDPGELLVEEGYLFVESRVKAQVFANGISIGPTNKRNKARCRYKFVRLGRVPGKWISEGVTVNIACGALTSVRLDPYPAFGNER